MPAITQATEQSLEWWIIKTEEFTKKHLGVEVDLRRQFAIPEKLPWQSAISVFYPGALTNREVVDKALKGQGLDVWEEVDVMKYAGSEAGEATLHFINNSLSPDEDTMNKTAFDLLHTKKSFLRQRGYCLAFGVYYFATGEHLDPKTFNWFPEDHLPNQYVACGSWHVPGKRVRFSWGEKVSPYTGGGARLAIQAPLRS